MDKNWETHKLSIERLYLGVDWSILERFRTLEAQHSHQQSCRSRTQSRRQHREGRRCDLPGTCEGKAGGGLIEDMLSNEEINKESEKGGAGETPHLRKNRLGQQVLGSESDDTAMQDLPRTRIAILGVGGQGKSQMVMGYWHQRKDCPFSDIYFNLNRRLQHHHLGCMDLGSAYDQLLNRYKLLQDTGKSTSGYNWIDSLCIDQSHEREKYRQILQMGQIYERSKEMTLWQRSFEEGRNLERDPILEEMRKLVEERSQNVRRLHRQQIATRTLQPLDLYTRNAAHDRRTQDISDNPSGGILLLLPSPLNKERFKMDSEETEKSGLDGRHGFDQSGGHTPNTNTLDETKAFRSRDSVVLGTLFLWLGWLGFNGGSAVVSTWHDLQYVLAGNSTLMSTSAMAFATSVLSIITRRRVHPKAHARQALFMSLLLWTSPVSAISTGSSSHSNCSSLLSALKLSLTNHLTLFTTPQPPFPRTFPASTILLTTLWTTTITVLLYVLLRSKKHTDNYIFLGILLSAVAGAVFAHDVPDLVFRYLFLGTNVALIFGALVASFSRNEDGVQKGTTVADVEIAYEKTVGIEEDMAMKY